MTFGAGVWEEEKLSLPFSWFSVPQGHHCPGCWHAQGLPEVSVSFLPAGTGTGGMQGHRALGWVSSGSECDANELQWVPESERWEAALWACAFSSLLTAPAGTAPSPPPGFPGSDQPSRSPSLISFSAVLPAGET